MLTRGGRASAHVNKTVRSTLALVAALAVLAAACGGDDSSDTTTQPPADPPAEQQAPIRMLLSVPLSGDSAESGEDLVNGARLAADYLNQEGGVADGPLQGAQFVVEAIDDELTVEASTTIASRFVDDEGIWALGGFMSSAQAQAAAVVAGRAGLGVLSSFSCADFLTDEADNIVVICGRLDDLAKVSVDFAVTEFDARELGLVAPDFSFLDTYYQGIDAQVETSGATIVSRQIYTYGAADFSTALTSLESSGAQVLLSGNLQADAGRVLSQARQSGNQMPFVDFLGEGWGETFFETAGPAATQDAYGIDGADVEPESGSFAADITSRYQEAHGKRMSTVAMHGFDTMMTLAAAIEAGASDRSEVLAHVQQASGSGILGPIEFTDELRPMSRVAIVSKITGTSPGDRDVAARYEMNAETGVRRVG